MISADYYTWIASHGLLHTARFSLNLHQTYIKLKLTPRGAEIVEGWNMMTLRDEGTWQHPGEGGQQGREVVAGGRAGTCGAGAGCTHRLGRGTVWGGLGQTRPVAVELAGSLTVT